MKERADQIPPIETTPKEVTEARRQELIKKIAEHGERTAIQYTLGNVLEAVNLTTRLYGCSKDINLAIAEIYQTALVPVQNMYGYHPSYRRGPYDRVTTFLEKNYQFFLTEHIKLQQPQK